MAYCRRQSIVTTSTACAEILALSSLVKKLAEIVAVLRSVKLDPRLPIQRVYCDNTAAVLAGKMYTSCETRHLALQLTFIREAVIKDKWIYLHPHQEPGEGSIPTPERHPTQWPTIRADPSQVAYEVTTRRSEGVNTHLRYASQGRTYSYALQPLRRHLWRGLGGRES